jgi:hypothetical protein
MDQVGSCRGVRSKEYILGRVPPSRHETMMMHVWLVGDGRPHPAPASLLATVDEVIE